MMAPQGIEDVRLDEVQEGEQALGRIRKPDDGRGALDAPLSLVGPTDNPVPERGRRDVEVSRRLAYRVGSRLQNVAASVGYSSPSRRDSPCPGADMVPRSPGRLYEPRRGLGVNNPAPRPPQSASNLQPNG